MISNLVVCEYVRLSEILLLSTVGLLLCLVCHLLPRYTPSAPSPTFPALGPSPLQQGHEEGFSFMHESEVNRGECSNYGKIVKIHNTVPLVPILGETCTRFF